MFLTSVYVVTIIFLIVGLRLFILIISQENKNLINKMMFCFCFLAGIMGIFLAYAKCIGI